MKNKLTIILSVIFILLIMLIVFFSIRIINKKEFVKPGFDINAKAGIPNVENIDEKILEINDGYKFYIEPNPVFINNQLQVNFVSLKENTVLLKIRILDENKNILGESGILKPGEYVKHIKINKKIEKNTKLTYLIMGYEKESYMSAGTVTLNTKVGE